MPVIAPLRPLKSMRHHIRHPKAVPAAIQHSGYLTVAKSRAKILKAITWVLPIPRPLLFVGGQSCHELCDMMINEGATHVLIVTDAVLNQLGIPDKITQYLSDNHIRYHLYAGITPDPTFKVIETGLRQSISAQCDAVLAIGGGSVIDAAKIIAVSQATQLKPKQLIGLFKATACLPLYCVPTTAGTGSEATIGAVVSDDQTHQKAIAIDPRMVPLAAAIDPTIMQGMPPHITADTGIDVLTHALEAWMSVNASGETDYYAASAVKAVLHYLPLAFKDGNDLKAREEMGLAAHYGGIALNKAGLGYVHAIAHQLGAHYGIAHGRANAIVLPYILEVNRSVCAERLASLAKKIGVVERPSVARPSKGAIEPDGTGQPPHTTGTSDTTTTDTTGAYATHASPSDAELTDYFIAQVKGLLATLNINPQIDNMQVSDFDSIAKAAAIEVRDTYSVPLYLTIEQIKDILQRIMQQSAAA